MEKLYRTVRKGDLIRFTVRGYGDMIIAFVLEAYHYEGIPEQYETLFFVHLIEFNEKMYLEPSDLEQLEIL